MALAGWIGVDLDGTLVTYDGWKGVEHLGEPIPAMCDRVRNWLAQGQIVKIFTARVTEHSDRNLAAVLAPIHTFCVQEFNQLLEVTNVKDFGMIELWDDRAVQVEINTGRIVGEAS